MSKCWSEKNVQNVPANRTKVFLSEVYRPKSLSPNIFVANVRLFLCLSLVRTKVHLLVGLKDVYPANWSTLSRPLLALLLGIVSH